MSVLDRYRAILINLETILSTLPSRQLGIVDDLYFHLDKATSLVESRLKSKEENLFIYHRYLVDCSRSK